MVGLVVLAGCSGRGEIIPTPSPEPQTPTTAGTQLSAAPTTVLAATTSTAPQVRRLRPTTSTSLRVQTTTTIPSSDYEYGEWAIPRYIVMCESKGNWMAHNASGASGPYQLMPLHFGGELAMNQSRQSQHNKAAQLWNGGAGRHHWRECL